MSRKLFDFRKLKIFSEKVFIIHRTAQNEERIYNYREIITASQVLTDLLTKINVRKTRVSIQCPHCPELCVILLSILNGECSFCAISHDASEDESKDTVIKFGSPFFISHICFSENNGSIKLLEKTTILKTEFYIFRLLELEYHVQRDKLENECYCVKTSGSTGTAKVVRVPYHCIAPNIKCLSDFLGITCRDLILMSTPITFDPFVVEYFLALWNGAALLITSSRIRLTPGQYAEILQPKQLRGVSVMQMTPSLFRLFGLNNMQEIILNNNTSLRILLLGGERFPSMEEISDWTSENHYKTRVFNIYGITEVSCWSTIYEIKCPQTEKCIPIGFPIDSETQIRLVNDMNEPIAEGYGNIQIGSCSRKCTIDDEDPIEILSTDQLFRSTGDIGYISEGNIFYEGRKTKMFKRYGHRVHMGQIVKTILGIDGVLNTCCIFNDKNMRLICFILKNVNTTRTEIQQEILTKLKSFEKPDDIEFVDQFPLTSHGKISEKKLLCLYECFTNNTPVKILEKFITNVLCLDLESYKFVKSDASKKRKVSLDLSFLNAGGTSFQALTLSKHIEQLLNRPEPRLLEMLLNGTTTIASILEYVSGINVVLAKLHMPSKCNKNKNLKEMLKVNWQYGTGKCVDATPRCYGDVVCVGSHSHLLITLNSKTGQEISTCILPDRIECEVIFVDLPSCQVLVGCYDGSLYAIDYSCGKIDWKFDCGGMIKARPLQNENLVVIGSYFVDGNLLCLKLKSKSLLWKVQIGSKGIFASPLKINKKSLLACTLDGETVCVLFNTGRIVWKTKFQSPIFSTPAMLTEHAVLIAEVSGVVHCLNVNSGTEIWNLQTDGNIFSSIIVHNMAETTFIIFGNHDRNVYCLKSTQPNQHPCISWKSALNSAVYSTPAILNISPDILAVLACSTRGSIYILDFLAGSILFKLKMDNEIFSSPCIVKNRIYIGCRNNNLVCLELQSETQIKKT